MINSYSNVASNCCLSMSIDEYWTLFEEAGYSDHQLPDTEAWLPAEVTSGYVFGSVGIRNKVKEIATRAADRDVLYTSEHARKLMEEGYVLDKCNRLAPGIPKIAEQDLEKIIWELIRSKPRRNRKNLSCR